jgi:hypothetical protein
MSAPGEAKARRARRRASPEEADARPIDIRGAYKEAEG